MKKILKMIDGILDKLPPHITDLIQKAAISLAVIIALFAIVYGISKGMRDATPAGMQMVGKAADLFYLESLRNENAGRRTLIEDVPVDPMEFGSVRNTDPAYTAMDRDRMDHVIGESEEMVSKETLRPRPEIPMMNEDPPLEIPRFPEVADDTRALAPGSVLPLRKEEPRTVDVPKSSADPSGSFRSKGMVTPEKSEGKPKPANGGKLQFLE